MSSIRIIPRYKLLLLYDIRPDVYAEYQRYILGDFIPGLQGMGLYILSAWHTAYGHYRERQVEFVLEDLDVMRQAVHNEAFQQLEARLKSFTIHYERKLVRFRNGFQF